MGAILQTTFSYLFSGKNIDVFFIEIPLKYVPKNLINNNLALILIRAWCQTDGKSLCEPIVI